jgi:hypothetical protein
MLSLCRRARYQGLGGLCIVVKEREVAGDALRLRRVQPIDISAGGWGVQHVGNTRQVLEHHHDIPETRLRSTSCILRDIICSNKVGAMEPKELEGVALPEISLKPRSVGGCVEIAVGVARFEQHLNSVMDAGPKRWAG